MKAKAVVRPMEDEDLPQLLSLHEKVNGCPENTSRESLRDYLKRVFVDHPWRDEELPALVLEQSDGSLAGCLGVVPRPMVFGDREIRAAVSHSFVVSPEARTSLAALQLVRVFFNGPQDLSLCQGDEASWRIWERFGGRISQVHSLIWAKPLRPARYLLSLLEARGTPKPLASLLIPFTKATDAMAPYLVPASFKLPKPETDGEELDFQQLAQFRLMTSNETQLLPSYTAESWQWLLDTMQLNPNRGELRKVLVRKDERVLGWYLYYLRPGGNADVAQIVACADSVDPVLEHLFHDAWENGAMAVTGQADPALLHALTRHSCMLRYANSNWFHFHARDPALRDAIIQGQALLSRMEGEWWISELLR